MSVCQDRVAVVLYIWEPQAGIGELLRAGVPKSGYAGDDPLQREHGAPFGGNGTVSGGI